MKKTIKTIGITGAITILLCGAYLLGTTQVKTITIEKEMEVVPDEYIPPVEELRNNFVDMRKVVDFKATEKGLLLYLSDGSGYYLER